MAHVLGASAQAVLLAIVRLGDEAYGRAILKEVQTRLERDVAAGTVHAPSSVSKAKTSSRRGWDRGHRCAPDGRDATTGRSRRAFAR
jgi:hypothetical protein